MSIELSYRQNRMRSFFSRVRSILLTLYFPMVVFEHLTIDEHGSLVKYLAIVIIALWCFKTVVSKTKPTIPSHIWLFGFWLLFSLIMALILPGQQNETGTAFSLAIGMNTLLLLVAADSETSRSEVEKYELSYLFACVLFSILMLLRQDLYHGYSFRRTLSLFGRELDPNYLSALLAPGVLFSLSFARKYRNIFIRILLLFSTSLIVTSILMSGSRGGLLSLLISLVILGVQVARTFKFSVDMRRTLAMAMLLISLILGAVFATDSEFILRLNPISMFKDGGAGRTTLWKMAFEQFRSSPVFGIGLGMFYTTTNFYVHNTYLLVLAETGIIGFILFTSALFTLLVRVLRGRDQIGVALLVLMSIGIFFLDSFSNKMLWIPLWFVTAYVSNGEEKRRANPAMNSSH